MAHLHCSAANGVERLRRADDLAGREGLDDELAVRGFRNQLGEGFAAAEQGVEGFREGRGQAPANFRVRLGDGRLGNGSGGGADCSGLEKCTTFHERPFHSFPFQGAHETESFNATHSNE